MKKITTSLQLISLLAFNSLVFFIQNPIVLSVLLVLFVLILIPTKYSATERLKTLAPIGIMIIIFQLVFYTSLPWSQRFFFGYIAALKITLVSLSVLLFLSVTSLLDLAYLFDFLPKQWLLLVIMTGYLIPSILNDSVNIKMVQQSRGLKTNKLNILSSVAALIIPLLHRVFQRAETLSLTIIARGYED
jgi:energy-coupling factor transporter transmembrane protein EcfT